LGIISSILKKIGVLRHQPPFSTPFRRQIIKSMARPVDIKSIELEIVNKLQNNTVNNSERLNHSIDYLLNIGRKKDASNFFVAALRAMYDVFPEQATPFGLRNIDVIPDSRAIVTLVNNLMKTNDHGGVPKLLSLIGPSPWKVNVNTQLMKTSGDVTYFRSEEEEPKTSVWGINFSPAEKPPDLLMDGREISKLKVACILDEFSFNSFKYEANFWQLSVSKYGDELENFQPDLLFIESAWRGKDGLWGSKVGHADIEVIEILQWCKSNNIPTVFWNKEDPVHFRSFLNIARLFDYVFTTDIDCIQRYKSSLKHERVYLLPFAFQPIAHNPIEEFERINGMCFAGAYYKKYAERNKDFNSILNGVKSSLKVDIYDRNYLDDNPDYSFPEEYLDLIIGTLQFDEINLAYKGYDFGLNLNTIKHSQSMFARRVFELVASNTHVFSNYSRGIELLFGDIVFTSDSGAEIIKRYEEFDKIELNKLKLAGLRNVFSQHTYGHRFQYILSKLTQSELNVNEKGILVMSLVKSDSEVESVINNYSRQDHGSKKLIMLSNKLPSTKHNINIETINFDDLEAHFFEELMSEFEYISYFASSSYYGKNFLTDLLHSTNYIHDRAITKMNRYIVNNGGIIDLVSESPRYSKCSQIYFYSALIPKSMIMNKPVIPSIKKWSTNLMINLRGFSIDEFNYCGNGSIHPELTNIVDDIPLNNGIKYTEFRDLSELIESDENQIEGQYYSSAEFYQEICDFTHERVNVQYKNGKTQIESILEQGEHTYIYWPDFIEPSKVGFKNRIGNFFLDSSPGLRVMLAVVFYDDSKNKLGFDLSLANSNITIELPLETTYLRVGLRLYQQGITELNSLDLFHHQLTPKSIITSEKIIVISNNYPSYDEKYRNGFLHTRLKEYQYRGISVDMFVFRKGGLLEFREYEGIRVITGSETALHNILNQNNHSKILVHFLDSEMWRVIESQLNERELLVWVHGSEIQPWHRRLFNYSSEEEIEKEKILSQDRMDFWQPFMKNIKQNIKLIFVSNYFAEEVMEDTMIDIPQKSYQIIHNPINTSTFNYVEKDLDQRFKILSIRPFASNKYANDLTVKAIVHLSKSSIFSDLQFLIVGDGKLFDETLEPLKDFNNVTIQQGFLSHSEIASLHKEYGIFITPTRMDSQGVSRDEAMSSGMVPITTNVTAIPEFVDGNCGMLVDGEDWQGISNAIEMLVGNPELFLKLSASAAERVRSQTSSNIVIQQEIDLITGGM